MNRKTSISHLKKLYVLIDNIMGDTILGTKYTRSLRKSINSLERNKICVENRFFRVLVKNKKDHIEISILTKNGDVIDTLKYDNSNIISEDNIGNA